MREAAGLLAELGINRESARTALGAGLAGEVRRAGGAHLVEERSVWAVTERAAQAPVPNSALDDALRTGVFTARLGPRRATPDEGWRSWRGADLAAPEEEQLLAASAWWSLTHVTRAVFAVLGAEITGVTRDPASSQSRRCRFELAPSGPWYEELHGRRVLTTPGPPWVTLTADRIAG